MKLDIKKELSDNHTILLLMPSIEYNQDIVDVVKQLKGESICYVTLNKTVDSLRELFEKNGINTGSIVFIDAISRTFKDTFNKSKNCYFCSSPGALTEISLTISKLLSQKFEYLIFDSLTNLLVYEKNRAVAMFVSSIVNKAKGSGTRSVLYALSIKEQEELISETGMFVDKVIDTSKKS